jgi:hypothetical protein
VPGMDEPSLDDLGEAILGNRLRRLENRINQRFDSLELLIEQQAVDREALTAALEGLQSADTTIDAIEPEETT